MKITLWSSSSGSRGGGEFYLLGLAKALTAVGHDVDAVMNRHPQMDELAASFAAIQIDVARVEFPNTYHRRFRALGAVGDRRGQSRIANVMEKLDSDILHLNLQNVEDGLDLVLAASRVKCPTVATVHVTRTMEQLGAVAGRARDRVSRYALRTAAIPYIAVSPVAANDLRQHLGSVNHATNQMPRVFAVNNGVAAVEARCREHLRNAWGLPPDAFVVGTLARVESQKNPLFAVELLRSLPPHVHYVWIGDGRLAGALTEAIGKANLADRFHLLGWQPNASELLGGIDLFLLPSLYEGLPLAILEAMSAGLPCVVSDVDGTRDAIEHGKDGFLCPVNDIAAWTQTCQSLIDSPQLSKQIGEAARKRYEAEFSVEAMAKRTVEVYGEIVGSRQ